VEASVTGAFLRSLFDTARVTRLNGR